MTGFTTSGWDVCRKLGWRLLSHTSLVGGLLLGSLATVDQGFAQVEFTDGSESAAAAGPDCPTFECPPDWMPDYSSGPQYLAPHHGGPQYGGMAPGRSMPGQNQPAPAQPSSPLPQANPNSPVQAPFSPSTQGAQAFAGPQGGPGTALAAASAPSSIAPNMVGDFFGAIASKPLILPGTVVRQAILFEQTGGFNLLDYYRAINLVGPDLFETDNFVYLGTDRSGNPASVMPNSTPAQLLQEFDDGGVFNGDPADLMGDPLIPGSGGFLSDPGPFIALAATDSLGIQQTGDIIVNPPEDLPMPPQDPMNPDRLIDEPIYNIHEALLVFVPTPGSGGGVGRQKIAENTSPIPRDRIFLNQSTFTGVPFTNDGVTVLRFSPGIEKMFFNQRMSLEVRLPFASTIDSDISAGGGVDEQSTQFGNIVTTLKGLVHRTPDSAVAVGVSLTAPTAKDLVVDVDGRPLLSIENESVHVLPFVGGTNSRGRWFTQWYAQADIDTTGSPVDIRNVFTGQIEEAGVLHDAPMLYASVSGGYWIYQNGLRDVQYDNQYGRTVKRTVYTNGGITGIAPIVEFHVNQSLDKSEVISSGPIELRSASDFSLTNLVVGGTMTFGSGGSLTLAWGTPIIGQDDKQFGNEARVVFDWEY